MEYSEQDFSSTSIIYRQSLRNYMLRVYYYMTSALALTGFFAILPISSDIIMNALYVTQNNRVIGFSPFGWFISIAPVAIALAFSFGLPKMKASSAQLLFWSYAILLGLSLSSLFFIYKGESIAHIFFVAASIFGVMSLYGYLTRTDLTSFGSFLIMGVVGVIIASLVNLYLKKNGLNFAISIISALIFTGLAAFDTQRIKNTHDMYQLNNRDTAAKIAIMGALILYLDFVNIFIHLLQLFGKKKEE